MNDFEHEYGLLVEAIIRQAIYDYQNTLKYLPTATNTDCRKHNRCEKTIDLDFYDSAKLKEMSMAKNLLQERVDECEKFFNSKWYAALLTIPGQRFIDRVNWGIATGNLICTRREFATGGD